MPELQLVRLDHAPALLVFERENRAYFAAAIPDRGDEFFAEFDARHAQLLEWQAARTDYFHVLVAESGEVVGRVNLIDAADGSAELGYRIAQKAAGKDWPPQQSARCANSQPRSTDSPGCAPRSRWITRPRTRYSNAMGSSLPAS
jgi:hypothetical protein